MPQILIFMYFFLLIYIFSAFIFIFILVGMPGGGWRGSPNQKTVATSKSEKNDLIAIYNYYTVILNNCFRFFYFGNVFNYFKITIIENPLFQIYQFQYAQRLFSFILFFFFVQLRTAYHSCAELYTAALSFVESLTQLTVY